jgi:S-DNA-T family DNA segregation ATPase FtsK/SpoIIIE
MKRQLDLQADRIETLLASHNIRARVWGGTVLPRTVRFALTTSLDTKIKKLSSLSNELAMALNANSVRIYRQGKFIAVEVPRDNPETLYLRTLLKKLPPLPPFSTVVGIDQDGYPLVVRLDSPDVSHLLLVGRTGSGKTALLRAVLASLAASNKPHKLQMFIVDPKGRSFRNFRNLKHLYLPILTNVEQVVPALDMVLAKMEERERTGTLLPRIVVAIDELAEVTKFGGKSVLAHIERLTQRGRSAGIHLIAATQKPTAGVVGSLAKANFPVRLVGAVVSPEEAKIATGIAGSGAEKLEGRGDFLLVNNGNLIRFQAAYVGVDEKWFC